MPTYLFVRGNEATPDKDHPLSPGLPALFGGAEHEDRAGFVASGGLLPRLAIVRAGRNAGRRPNRSRGGQEDAGAGRQAVDAAQQQLAAMSSKPESPAEPAAAQPFLSDNFAAARPELWQTGEGDWEYLEGKLLQKQTGAQQCRLISLANHPQDFTASFRLQINGGQRWKSVGLSFDATEDGSYQGVYLSPVESGSKLQIYHAQQGKQVYPPAGAKPLPIGLNRPYLLKVDVRGDVANISVDGQMLLAYRLPIAHGARAGWRCGRSMLKPSSSRSKRRRWPPISP